MIGHIPSFRVLTDTYEAALRRQFGANWQRRTSGQTDTTTTTTMAPGYPLFEHGASTSTSTTPAPGHIGLMHPLEPLEDRPIRLHLFSEDGDVLASTAVENDKLEVLLYKFCRSLHSHGKLRAGVEIAAHNRAIVASREVSILLHTRREGNVQRFWVLAPFWCDSPLLLKCGEGYSRAGLFTAIGVPNRPEFEVIIRGSVFRRSVHPSHGDVVIITSPEQHAYSVPHSALLDRITDIQALLFRHTGPGAAAMVSDQSLKVFWKSAIRHCQRPFGLDRVGARVSIASTSMSCFVVCLGTFVFPSLAQVQEFYNEHLASKFGRRYFRDTTHMDRDNALLFEPLVEDHRRLWIVRLPTGIDARVADHKGDELRGRHLGLGWYLQPVTSGRRFGIACYTRQAQTGPVARMRPELLPGLSDESDECEFIVPPPRPDGICVNDNLRSMAADLRRLRDEGLEVSAPRTPPAAFRGLPPPPLTPAQSQAEREVVRVVIPDFNQAFPVFARIIALDEAAPPTASPETLTGQPARTLGSLSSSSSSVTAASSEAPHSEGASLLQRHAKLQRVRSEGAMHDCLRMVYHQC